MKFSLKAAIQQSLKYYIDKDISGAELSKSIKLNADQAEELSKSQSRTFAYYINFFEKEGDALYLDSNKYLKEEAAELGEFLSGLELD